MSTPERLVPSPELIRRILDADCAYTASRLAVLGRLPGNPVGVEHRRIGGAWAYRARYLPIESFNRVVGLANEQADEVAALVAWFADNGSSGRFEIAPGAAMTNLAAALTNAGYGHSGFHATLYGDPNAEGSSPAEGVTVEAVSTPAEFDTFLDVYNAGWERPRAGLAGFKANVAGWLSEPGWTMYLARCDGKPAGEAILYLSDGVGYLADSSVDPAFRGRGVHRALIERRRQDARAAGAAVISVQAAYLSTSHRNMVRAGLNLLFAQALWTARP